MSITAKELAKLLGVSPTTVSMVLNNKGQISPETRERVLRAAEEYGLRHYPRGISISERSLLLVVYRRSDSTVSDIPLIEVLVERISAVIRRLCYRLAVLNLTNDQSPMEQQRLLAEQSCSGILALSLEGGSELLPLLAARSTPLVLLGNWPEQRRFDCVSIDFLQGMTLAVQALREQGHTRIGFLSGTRGSPTLTHRRSLYRAAAAVCFPEGRPDSPFLTLTPTLDGSYQDMMSYLSGEPELPTAFLADSDLVAAGCLLALRQTGYCVPEDVSLIGLGNLPLCEVTTPPLTSVAISGDQLGTLGIQLMEARLQGAPVTAPSSVAVVPTLMHRKSTAALPQASPTACL